ncbi:MAG: ATP-binding cassette domain-containing protein [Saccharofermentanales bacterium]
MLKVDNVFSGYGDIQIINGISLTVEPGKIVAIVGSNGVGKSTLLKTITGMIRQPAAKHIFTIIYLPDCPRIRFLRWVSRWCLKVGSCLIS